MNTKERMFNLGIYYKRYEKAIVDLCCLFLTNWHDKSNYGFINFYFVLPPLHIS